MEYESTSIDISDWFSKGGSRPGHRRLNSIRLELAPAATNKLGNKETCVYFTYEEAGPYRFISEGYYEHWLANKGEVSVYEWKPASHTRCFEWFDTVTIQRAQGIGVLVDERCDTYCKFYYDVETLPGVSIKNCANLSVHSREELMFVLTGDLSMGYECFHIKPNGEVETVCEPRDERDRKESLVYFHPP